MIYLEHYKQANGRGYKYRFQEVSDYEYKMINQSDQQLLIPVSIEKGYLKYNITSMIPLSIYFKSHCIELAEIKAFMIKMIDSLAILEDYLLTPQKIAFQKEYIFMSNDLSLLQFIYVVDASVSFNFHEQVKETLLYLLLNHPSFKFFYQKQDFKKILSWLQDEHFDSYVFKALLKNEPVKKDKWSIKKLFSKEKVQVLSKETIMLQPENGNFLMFDEKKVPLEKSHTIIGRSLELTDFALPEVLSMGRVHAEVIKEDLSYYLVDLNSKNGTFVNGRRLDPQKRAPLKEGDVIKFANKKCIFK